MNKAMLLGVLGLAVLAGTAQVASAQYTVSVGYADNLRANPFFPNPWDGSPNTTFLGGGGSYDAGAILIVNTGSSPIQLQDAVVDGFGGSASFQLWNLVASPVTIDPGKNVILTQTTTYNFDTSDFGGTPGSPDPSKPKVHLTIDGVTGLFVDTAQILNTKGYDVATYGFPVGSTNPDDYNESFQWRLIGGSGTRGGDVPEPGAVAMVAAGALSMGGLALRRRARK